MKCLPYINPNERGIGMGTELNQYAMHKMLNILITFWFEV